MDYDPAKGAGMLHTSIRSSGILAPFPHGRKKNGRYPL